MDLAFKNLESWSSKWCFDWRASLFARKL